MTLKLIDLRQQPDVAREIGFLVMHVANLELMLATITTAILKDDDLSEVIARGIDNVKVKSTILFTLAKARRADAISKAVIRGEKAIREATRLRDKLSHSFYIFDAASDRFELLSNALNARPGPLKCEPVEAAKIAEVCGRLENAILEIVTAGGDRLQNPME